MTSEPVMSQPTRWVLVWLAIVAAYTLLAALYAGWSG
jgi:hypothetical protein